ncbi:hypothetical protein ACIBG8_34655 [Nonomuraea sp. NPDC050556]|uniref:phosphorylase family protein n=1 Tax=Nonomuraea sp. NPDC050556 TaxID=3364369 RepID=UPI003797AFA3
MIGVITALPVESAALAHVLGSAPVQPVPHDRNLYAVVDLNALRVVTTSLATTGNPAAADACANLVRSFPSVRAVIMCGIALGAPGRGVLLGDVVVGSGGVFHYSHRRVTDEGSSSRGLPQPASPGLLRHVNEVRAAEFRREAPWLRLLTDPPPAFARPPSDHDCRVHYGRIGSGDELLRSAARRDQLAAADDLLAIEMEAAGVAVSAALSGRECLVVRGISDYGDADKNDAWQPAAALSAAAYVWGLLEQVSRSGPTSVPDALTLVGLMEQVPSLQTPEDRHSVLRLVDPRAAAMAPQDRRTRPALLGLVSLLQQYPSGLDDLVRVLQRLEGEDSAPVCALEAALRNYDAQ